VNRALTQNFIYLVQNLLYSGSQFRHYALLNAVGKEFMIKAQSLEEPNVFVTHFLSSIGSVFYFNNYALEEG
jgi:hypothetical protein